ncbi:MAG: BrnA antitoxin family protein [Candidatus Omnitrophica bacterium]|nr:BrnA antitoxin family protein [Candidatus Omnitrophota bacterium]MBU0896622.1 BrnA antitoxin family protein [Candidatus Omnitrophota bacterium]MBU1134399.1 BrnA antitoxin family protein [Candidatus Omnitrophota bacterium]MBU1366830.1 BrnA antitoxin family protein [Candidatus Omnitrophota bacterium]MBU1523897.1 BrnA antitoxin family protein [Candidatus Omnitrophota bacterium]
MPKIPKFKNEAEEVKFWDTHDSTLFLNQMKEIHDIKFPEPQYKSVVVDLESQHVEALKRLAHKKHIPYHTLIQRWIKQNLSKEVQIVEQRTS